MYIMSHYHLPNSNISCYHLDKIPEGILIIKPNPESWYPNYSLQKVIYTKEISEWIFKFYKECRDEYGHIFHNEQIMQAICSNKHVELECYSSEGVKDIIFNIINGEVNLK